MPKTTKRSKQSHGDSRALLMSSAKKLFAKKGFDGTTIREISDDAGVNVSLISYNFGGKSGLLEVCIGEFGKERLQQTQELLTPIKTAEEFTEKICLHISNFLIAHAKDLDVSKIIHWEMQKYSPLFQDLLESIFFKTQMAIGMFFKNAQDLGVIRKELDIRELTIMLQGVLSYHLSIDHIRAARNAPTLDNPDTIKGIVFHIKESFLRGIMN